MGLELKEECRVRDSMLDVIRIIMLIEFTEVDVISQGIYVLPEVRKHYAST